MGGFHRSVNKTREFRNEGVGDITRNEKNKLVEKLRDPIRPMGVKN